MSPAAVAWTAMLLVAAIDAAVLGQEPPEIAYVHPAGIQRGATAVVTIGGRNLDTVAAAHFAASGLTAEVLERHRPLNQRERNMARTELEALATKAKAGTLTKAERNRIVLLRKQIAESRREISPQLAETVTLQLRAAQDAAIGRGELRLRGERGLSNPLRFLVGTLPERVESETSAGQGTEAIVVPGVVDGRLLAADCDRFRFRAAAGTRMVAALQARELIPFLADAVPGWFQGTLTIRDAQGNEVAYIDDCGPDPDPLITFVAPADGDYVVEVRDALCRGREDFVYRLTVGELPVVTAVFPLGDGSSLRDADIAADDLPEVVERSLRDRKLPLALPVVVNGTIEAPGEVDDYAFVGNGGVKFVAEVVARRLGSPLDARIVLHDPNGRVVAANDDSPELLRDIATDAADALLECTLPRTGVYRLQIDDARRKGGVAHHYRLRLGPRRPDFDLRVAPSAINVATGGTAAFTVHVARREGFAGDVELALIDPPTGYRLDGAVVPAGVDRIALTLTVPAAAAGSVVPLTLAGMASVGGRGTTRRAVPADDRTQAFAYHHLVEAEAWSCCHLPAPRRSLPAPVHSERPVKLRRRGTVEIVVTEGLRAAAPRTELLRGLRLVLRDPPPGVHLGELVLQGRKLVLMVTADGTEALAGLRGNLIVDVVAGGRQPVRVVATLPAIPFRFSGG